MPSVLPEFSADTSHVWPWSQKASTGASNDVGQVFNATLGFEKVLALGLPERSDKRDALVLMSELSGFHIEWIDGVKPADLPSKAVPYGIDATKVGDNFLGSWRSHMNAIRFVVEAGVGSALIMEDDVDWDVHIKSQLQAAALGARHVLGQNPTSSSSPYGDDWDLLWLGHCGEPFPENLEEISGLNEEAKARISSKFNIENDDTVPPYQHVSTLVDWAKYPPGTRIVHRTAAPICSFAYAVSQRGARRLLHALSIEGLSMAFDNSLAQLCRDAVFDLARGQEQHYVMKCISINPTTMFHHKSKGLLSGDSDIQNHGQGGEMREKGFTESIMWSTRLNLKNLLTGQSVEAQFV
ncbi:family 25 glycosyltransferase [Emericellopsis atlantica]|uniref:Family 25 glycosyltransferase n=1 Tax=Emericellopsis atlantica TaxID=2614577 RepID=A0A9P8CM41_9HYPO|nr:family 25 glycosyltransferase [Emericellopsis atlantica]KAG9251697.1 family 25 glycosyltransferase [Emericellopsis atlantica]